MDDGYSSLIECHGHCPGWQEAVDGLTGMEADAIGS